MLNRRITFARVPQGLPVPEDFSRDAVEIVRPTAGQFRSRTLWLSLDPYLRNVMKGHALYGVPLKPGDPMYGETVAQVVESLHPQFSAGDFVVVKSGWQQYALSDGQGVRKIAPEAAPLSTALGVLGMPGLTGYAGLIYLGEPKPGETVLVPAATGPVGSDSKNVRHLFDSQELLLGKKYEALSLIEF